MKYKKIDINCDVGEGIGNEEQLMPLISSCNIACGGHAGDAASIRETIRRAIINEVKIGAHPSYPDKENFGREVMDIPTKELQSSIKEQLQLFCSILEKEGGKLHHIKPHGALYNVITKDKALANVFLEAISVYKKRCYLYVPFASKIEELAKVAGFKIKNEVFADRRYNDDLSLVSRKKKNAVIVEPEIVLHHVKRMALNGLIKTISNSEIPIKSETFCVHGDTPSALKILMYLQQELLKYQLKIA